MSKNHPLLGTHKPSSEWYTPIEIVAKTFSVFQSSLIFDPCPMPNDFTFYTEAENNDGLSIDWGKYKYIYCNPPTPAKPWALKAIETARNNNTCIIFACFSEAVIWQVNELLNHPTCWVRNRIKWIDGKTLEPSKAPRNYNAFVCVTPDPYTAEYFTIIQRFCKNFADLGTVQISREVYIP